MKILLIRPDVTDMGISSKKLGIFHQPLGLLYLAAALEGAGHRAVICDEIVGDDYRTMMIGEKPDMVGITITSPLFRRACMLMEGLKTYGVPIVIGGPHVSALPEQSLRDSLADLAAVGEAEQTLVDIADGRDPSTIPGLYYRSGQEIRSTEARVPPEIDNIRPPARHLLDRHKYLGEHEIGFSIGRTQSMVRIFTSRGCPFSCTFCSTVTIFGRHARFRNVDAVMDEMFEAMDRWQTRNLVFMDDTLTMNAAHITAICEAILRSGKKIRWGCFARAGISGDIVALMKRAGCHLIGFGVESGSPAVLKRIKKRITPEQVYDSIQLCRKNGIRSKAFIMIGLPGETEEDFRMTIDLCLRARPDFLTVSTFVPLPGSEIMKELPEAIASEFLRENFYHSNDPVIYARHIELLRRFHLRPAYVLQMMKNFTLREIPDYLHMMKAFLAIQDKKA